MAHSTETATSTASVTQTTGLGELEKRVLSYAAAIGSEFDWSVLAAATEMEEETLAEILERLVHRGILKELNWGDSYAFVQVVTLAQTYSDISSSRVRVIHRRIAEAYEKLHPDPSPRIIPEMGRHFHIGGVHDRSLLYNRYAATLAMNAFSPDVAMRYLERAREDLAALPGDHRVEEADVLKDIGEQYAAMGDNTQADQFYGESLKKLPDEEVTLRALILLARANTARDLDQLGSMRLYCEEAIRLLEKAGHKKGLAKAHRTLSRAAIVQGQFDVGKREIEATLGFLDPDKDATEVARCYIELGNALSGMLAPDDLARAVEYYRKAIQTLEPLHDYYELARAHINTAFTLRFSHPREALMELKEARSCAESCKAKRLLGIVLFNSVEIHLSLGEAFEAAQNNMEASRIFFKINDPKGMQQVELNEGMLAQHRKAYADSERLYLSSLKKAEDLGYPPFVVEALIHMATMYEEWGKKDEAIKEVSRIDAIGKDQVDPTQIPTYEALKKRLGMV
jgi:tetratricopeptide (TPR) repeat protein